MPARRTKKAARSTAAARRAKPRSTAKSTAKNRVAARKAAAPAKQRVTAPKAAAPAKKRPAAKRSTRPAAPSTSPRAAAVRDLERGCDAILAAIRGLSADAAERPIAPGRWNARQILLHLAYWDEWMLGVLPAAVLRNQPHEPLGGARVNAANAAAVAAGKDLPWDEVRRLWAEQRALLLGLLAAVPAKPAERWTKAHALGAALDGYATHDRHHAQQIRDARKRKAPAFTPAFAPQRASANAKELMLFDLQRARTAVQAALKGLSGGSGERPLGPGRWTVRELVLHLAARDQARLDEFDAVLAGANPSWKGVEGEAMAKVNESHLAPWRGLSWDEALGRMQVLRDRLVTALLAVPAEPAERWTAAHPFGAMLLALVAHDRHHAEQVKLVRIS